MPFASWQQIGAKFGVAGDHSVAVALKRLTLSVYSQPQARPRWATVPRRFYGVNARGSETPFGTGDARGGVLAPAQRSARV